MRPSPVRAVGSYYLVIDSSPMSDLNSDNSGWWRGPSRIFPRWIRGGKPLRNCRLPRDRKSTRLNSSHGYISYAVFCLKKKNKKITQTITIIGESDPRVSTREHH